MSDWIGLLFFAFLIVGAVVGLKILAKPRRTTAEEFERNAAESASMLSASMNALNEMLNPEAAKSKEVEMQLKEGRFNKKKREGKANSDLDIDEF
ncbi:MAG: hypothetical protein R2747_24495 [Pyrinomonadaceae bacterium]